MGIEIGPWPALIVVAVLTYLTRVGGVLVMSQVTITPRIERFLQALSGSVLVALVAPAVVAGDLAAKAAVAVAIAVYMATRSAVTSMGAGILVAVFIRFTFGAA